MSIYCPLAEALGIETSISINDIPHSYDEQGGPVSPWNKDKKGIQENPYKGTTNRYSKRTLKLISKNTRKAMANLSSEKKSEMWKRNKKNGQKCWLHNDEGVHKRVDIEHLNEFLVSGWKRGRKLSHCPKTGRFMNHNME